MSSISMMLQVALGALLVAICCAKPVIEDSSFDMTMPNVKPDKVIMQYVFSYSLV